MKDYNFANNYENINLWDFKKDVNLDSTENIYKYKLLKILKTYPNLLNSLKTKKILYVPSFIVLSGVIIIEMISLIPKFNINRLEVKHIEYEEKVNSLNKINRERERNFKNLKKHSSLLSNPAPTYLFAFLLQDSIPKNVQLVDYTVDNVGFKLNAISEGSDSTKKFISLLLENEIIDNKSLKINRLVNQSPGSTQNPEEFTNNKSIVLEISGKINHFSLIERINFHEESDNNGVYKKLSLYLKLLELLK
ncbi:hypothetical protein CU313_05575 [Prochlorococcus marinus str. MU1404]|uniref:hypothetical protein n=1 Tax=Prochlorococcus marinus TaxID=1219 RepID=UPI001ADBDDE5|nr:hypothetical protein [Prochlorococcus marinus]MBO8229878.1 hypothetical protein [Prochlorococcus marinus XMU1404]MBW3073337.1 hypothetical protein [Prochlorococcus marinus str. MU1404]MCR8545786.1 hypothetical protein [Prochlorococcus marinus CUG1432]